MDDFFSPPSPADPTSTFLDRERAAGLDSSFGTSSNVEGDYDFESSANTFPDLDGDFDGPVPVVPQQHTFQPSSQQPKVSVTNDNEFAAFEEDYPEIDVGTQSSLPLVSLWFHCSVGCSQRLRDVEVCGGLTRSLLVVLATL